MTEKKSSGAAVNGSKDVIYIDVDDEITAIIEKVRDSDKKIVALVLPKRATVLQSVVNMKLLKRAADGSKKNLVLITSEAGLLPLAGSVGLHVAKSLQSKPEIPDAPDNHHDQPEEVEDAEDTDAESEEPVDKTRTVGELAGAAAVEDTIEMDDEDDAAAAEADSPSPKDKKKGRKFSIPNFNRFRLLLTLGIAGLVVLGVLAYLAFAVLPKAAIDIKTDTSAVDSSTTLTLKTAPGTTLDVPSGTVAAHQQVVQKTISQQVAATGQQNNGQKATGSAVFYNCNLPDTISGTDHVIPAGTGVSANGLTFVTAQSVTVSPSNYNGNTCKKNKPSASVGITALAAGAKYNQAATTYAVAGYSTISGDGSATTGGTDDITKIVTQADIDSASQKIATQDATPIKQELKTDLANGKYFPIEETFNIAAPSTKTSANAGDAADNVTVTQTINYTMLGVQEGDLNKIIANDVSDQIDPKKQSILDYGLDKASYNVQSQTPDGEVLIMQTTVVAGPDLDVNAIKKQVAGKKSGDAQEIIKAYPGVTSVKVTYSPFWVSSIPSSTGKITVTVEKPQVSKSNGNQP